MIMYIYLTLSHFILSCASLNAGDAYNLFAFPSECNFSGLRFSLDLVKIIKEDSERILEGSPFCKYMTHTMLCNPLLTL